MEKKKREQILTFYMFQEFHCGNRERRHEILHYFTCRCPECSQPDSVVAGRCKPLPSPAFDKTFVNGDGMSVGLVLPMLMNLHNSIYKCVISRAD